MTTTILFTVATLSFLICGMIASGKERSFIGWGAFGFLTPLIGLIVVLCLDNARQDGVLVTCLPKFGPILT